MVKTFNIEARKPIWIALSNLYLDTELQETDFIHIAIKIIESPYTFAEVKKIDKFEIFPILQSNLLQIAGEWTGFNEEWLISSIIKSLEKRKALKQIWIKGYYFTYKWMHKDHWEALDNMYNQIKANPKLFNLT